MKKNEVEKRWLLDSEWREQMTDPNDAPSIDEIASFDREIAKSLKQIEPTTEGKKLVVTYMLTLAANIACKLGYDVNKFLEEARDAYRASAKASEEKTERKTQPSN